MATKTVNFPVTLSRAVNSTVTVNYTTQPTGAAAAGTDFTATTGTLTFVPGGPLTQNIPVVVQVEAAGTLGGVEVVLSNPVNATISNGTSPSYTISAAAVVVPTVTVGTPVLGANPTPTPFTPLSAGSGTLANQFVDANGNVVRLRGFNWYGYDGPDLLPHGMYTNVSYKQMLDQFRAWRFNCVRIPFSDDMVTSSIVFDAVGGNNDSFYVGTNNPDLVGLTPLQALDAIIYYCSQIGMRVILDHHRISMTGIHAYQNTAAVTSGGSSTTIPVASSSGLAVGNPLASVFNANDQQIACFANNTVITGLTATSITVAPALTAAVASGMTFNFVDSGYGTDGWPTATIATDLYTYGASYTPRTYTATTWTNMWKALATHFSVNSTVPGITGAGQYASNAGLAATIAGFDPHNEPHNVTWNQWNTLVTPLILAVLAIQPNWMAFVEGVGASENGGDTYWEGGYLVEVATNPINLESQQKKLAYSAHEYAHSVFGQTWLTAVADPGGNGYPTIAANTVTGYPNNLQAVWDKYWGFVFNQNIAPLWISEMGGGFGYDATTGATDPKQLNAANETLWINSLIPYLNGTRTDANNYVPAGGYGPSFAYFALNPESGNPLGGLLEGDFVTPQAGKLTLIENLLIASTPLGA